MPILLPRITVLFVKQLLDCYWALIEFEYLTMCTKLPHDLPVINLGPLTLLKLACTVALNHQEEILNTRLVLSCPRRNRRLQIWTQIPMAAVANTLALFLNPYGFMGNYPWPVDWRRKDLVYRLVCPIYQSVPPESWWLQLYSLSKVSFEG